METDKLVTIAIEFGKVLVPAMLVLLQPIITWMINRAGTGKRHRVVELRIKELELLEKAIALHKAARESDGPLAELAIEKTSVVFEDIKEKIESESKGEELKKHAYKKLTWFKKLLLLFKPYSTKGWVYRILYYMNLYAVLVMPFAFYSISKEGTIDLLTLIPGYAVYIILAYVFHRAAIRDAQKHEQQEGS